jgi:hypothetical protein
MITRRGMLAATGGLAALAAAGDGAAETPTLTVATKRRNGPMEIKRSGSQPSRKGPADYFTGAVRVDPLFQAPIRHALLAPASHSSRGRAPPGIRIRSARL